MLSQQKFQSEKSPPTNSELRKNNWKVFLVNSKKSKAVSIWKKEYQEAVISSWRIKNLILILGKNISRMKSPVKKFWTSTSYIGVQSCPTVANEAAYLKYQIWWETGKSD